MEEFHADPDFTFIDTDVAFGPLTQVICDAHDIPLPDESVDAVVLQAVLEHVLDPARVVAEVCRVLKPDGIVYAETPFLQPAHATPYDFQRFTFIGYRRLFASFSKIDFGPVGGPGQALGWQYENAALCLSSRREIRAMIYLLVRWTGFWLKHLDVMLNRNPHALHCAFGLYFLGQMRPAAFSDSEIIDECRRL
jgi:SAM-dependent methyltransferase